MQVHASTTTGICKLYRHRQKWFKGRSLSDKISWLKLQCTHGIIVQKKEKEGIERERERQRQTDRQAGRQADRQRQRDRDKETERQRHSATELLR